MTGSNPHMPPEGNAPQLDAHGRAALLLVESLIHGLVAHRTLSTTDAIGIVDTAVDVQFDIAEQSGRADPATDGSHRLLANIGASLRVEDLDPDAPAPPAGPA